MSAMSSIAARCPPERGDSEAVDDRTGDVTGMGEATILLLVVLLVPLLAGCVPSGARSDGVPSAGAPFTQAALDVWRSTFPFRCVQRCPVAER
jgi:hypothetical protein